MNIVIHLYLISNRISKYLFKNVIILRLYKIVQTIQILIKKKKRKKIIVSHQSYSHYYQTKLDWNLILISFFFVSFCFFFFFCYYRLNQKYLDIVRYLFFFLFSITRSKYFNSQVVSYYEITGIISLIMSQSSTKKKRKKKQ